MTIHIGWLLEWVIPMVLVAFPGVFFGGFLGLVLSALLGKSNDGSNLEGLGMIVGVAIAEVSYLTFKGVVVWVL